MNTSSEVSYGQIGLSEQVADAHQMTDSSRHMVSPGNRSIDSSQTNGVNQQPAIVQYTSIPGPKNQLSDLHVENSNPASAFTTQGSDSADLSLPVQYIPIAGVRIIASPPEDGKKRKIPVRSSINPVNSSTYIKECEAAAIASRLPPHSMSSLEASVMREHISHLQVTTYIVTRNAILRLWFKNPMLWVSIEEAQGVAREERHFPLCRAIWEFLIRSGYINFGCLDVPTMNVTSKEQRQIVIVGAGISGLATARHLTTLLAVFQDRLQYDYSVKILEARHRIGGRVYSHALAAGPSNVLSKVDLGAQIITGFSGGNPLSILLQRQLALPYHSLIYAKNNKIHGKDGATIDHERDSRVEGLFNLLLDSAARYRVLRRHEDADVKPGSAAPVYEEAQQVEARTENGSNHVAVADKIMGIGKAVGPEASLALAADPLEELRRLGFRVKDDAILTSVSEAESLGLTMTRTLESFQKVAEISELDQDVLSWHWANMEYACGTNLNDLSLRYWDQDDGNEFRGNHAMMIGGYSQLARGLALAPSKLDIRTDAVVSSIATDSIKLTGGEIVHADKIVVSVPLGILKKGSLQFDPPLPYWKSAAIDRLGFGLLNKVVLVYSEQFWENEIDLLGTMPVSASQSKDSRGRFYMFWNCTTHASGRPVLVALMAGQAAIDCEVESKDSLVLEASEILQKIYPTRIVPKPVEVIATRWGQDPFSLGSYSFIGPAGSGLDYETMAKPIDDRLFFAGEATCRTHPSTVHGAYLSGLAAAKMVLDALIGEQKISADKALVPIKSRAKTSTFSDKTSTRKRKFDTFTEAGERFRSESDKYAHLKKIRLLREKQVLQALIERRIGARPELPKKINANPFLIFQKDQWNTCKSIADQAQQAKLKDPKAKASKNQIRACLGQTWRDTSDEGKQPWIDKVNQKRQEHENTKEAWEKQNAKWDIDCQEVIKYFEANLKPTLVTEEEERCRRALEGAGDDSFTISTEQLPNDGMSSPELLESDKHEGESEAPDGIEGASLNVHSILDEDGDAGIEIVDEEAAQEQEHDLQHEEEDMNVDMDMDMNERIPIPYAVDESTDGADDDDDELQKA